MDGGGLDRSTSVVFGGVTRVHFSMRASDSSSSFPLRIVARIYNIIIRFGGRMKCRVSLYCGEYLEIRIRIECWFVTNGELVASVNVLHFEEAARGFIFCLLEVTREGGFLYLPTLISKLTQNECGIQCLSSKWSVNPLK